MHQSPFDTMRQSIVDGAPDTAASLARNALEAGILPLDAIDHGFVPGMAHVGEEFARRTMFLPDMMASAEAMKAAMMVLEPELTKSGLERPSAGTVILGTTKGDIHEIGKTLVATLLTANGFTVCDLGVDVAAQVFAAKATELSADIVGVSALLTTTMRGQKGVVEALEKAGLRPPRKGHGRRRAGYPAVGAGDWRRRLCQGCSQCCRSRQRTGVSRGCCALRSKHAHY